MKKERHIILLLCISGVAAVIFGMARQNNPVFIAGIISVVAGYLLIRKKIRQSVKDRTGRNR